MKLLWSYNTSARTEFGHHPQWEPETENNVLR